MKRIKFYDDDQLVVLGARFASPDVAREADRAAGILARYGGVLSDYGIDGRFAAQFEELRRRHQDCMANREQGVAAKQNTLAHYNGVLHAAWTWLEQVHTILTPFARREREFAVRLNQAVPEAESELASAIAQMRQLLEEKKSNLGASVKTDELMAACADLEKQVENVVGSKLQAKNQARENTRELDRLDGELYLLIGDMYDAARKAVRANRIEAASSEFRYQYCQRAPRKTAVSKPVS